MNVVLDTNVLVSALKTRGGNCAAILDLALEGDLTLALDERILAEYERVCKDPRLTLDAESVRTVLDFVRDSAEFVAPRPLAAVLPDPDDRAFVEVAAKATAVLITGNKRHFPSKACAGVCVVSPAEFVDMLRNRC